MAARMRWRQHMVECLWWVDGCQDEMAPPYGRDAIDGLLGGLGRLIKDRYTWLVYEDYLHTCESVRVGSSRLRGHGAC